MIIYSFFKSGYLSDKPVFKDVSEVCFSKTMENCDTMEYYTLNIICTVYFSLLFNRSRFAKNSQMTFADSINYFSLLICKLTCCSMTIMTF